MMRSFFILFLLCVLATLRLCVKKDFAEPVRAFAFPGGGWNAGIAETVKGSGYRLAFTIDSGSVSCDDNPFALRRVNIHEGMTESIPMFLARLTGLF